LKYIKLVNGILLVLILKNYIFILIMINTDYIFIYMSLSYDFNNLILFVIQVNRTSHKGFSLLLYLSIKKERKRENATLCFHVKLKYGLKKSIFIILNKNKY
jgi:hypothetical protein